MPDTLTREETIEQFIREDALDVVLLNLKSSVASVGEKGLFDGLFSDDDVTAIANQSAGKLNDLWPEDDDLETAEHTLASLRSSVLVARTFSRLADRPEYLRALADHFAGLAERNAGKLAKLLSSN